MKRYIKSISVMLICIFYVSTYSVQIRAEEKTFGEGIAAIAFGENGWWEGLGAVWGNSDDPVSIEKQETAVLKGDGTYTISIDCGEERKELNFLCIQAYNIASEVGFTITSVKFDGTEYFNGNTGFTLLDDENENMRRSFILAPDDWYRSYENAVNGGKSPVTIAQDPYTTTSKLIDYSPEGWQTIEVTFEVFGMGVDDTAENIAAVKDEVTPDSAKNNTWLIISIAAGIVLLGVISMYIIKKRNH